MGWGVCKGPWGSPGGDAGNTGLQQLLRGAQQRGAVLKAALGEGEGQGKAAGGTPADGSQSQRCALTGSWRAGDGSTGCPREAPGGHSSSPPSPPPVGLPQGGSGDSALQRFPLLYPGTVPCHTLPPIQPPDPHLLEGCVISSALALVPSPRLGALRGAGGSEELGSEATSTTDPGGAAIRLQNRRSRAVKQRPLQF